MPKNVRISIDEQALRAAIQPQLDQLQAQMTAEVQEVVREVNAEMSGQPADQVYAELTHRLTQRLPDAELRDDNLRTVAEEIEAGTLED